MKRLAAIVLVLTCTLGSPGRAHAQDAATNQHVTWGFLAGGEGVTGAYRGSLAYGTTAGLLMQVPLASRHFSLRADFLDHSVSDGASEGCALSAPVGGGSGGCGAGCAGWFKCAPIMPWEMVVSASASAVFRLNDPAVKWSPYLLGGVAAYELERVTFASFKPNHIGFTGGVGFEVRPNRHTYFVEMRYLGIPPGGLTPVSIGMRF